jgi:hypothetical protein
MLLERNNLEKEWFKKVDGPDIENASRIFKYLLLPFQSCDKFRGTLSLSLSLFLCLLLHPTPVPFLFFSSCFAVVYKRWVGLCGANMST